jgi:hypothetical protein
MATERIRSNRSSLPKPPPARKPDGQIRMPGKDRPPLAPGVIYTPDELDTFKTLNIDPRKPLPGNLADLIKEAQAEAAQGGPIVPPDTKPIGMPEERPISDMPPDQQQALHKQIAEYQRWQAEQARAAQDLIPNAPPGVNEAIMATAAPQAEIVDDLRGRMPRAQAAARAEELPSAGGAEAPSHCERCNWQIGQTPPDISQEDKETYLQSLHGGTRFRKRYRLMGGRLALTFRELTGKEINLAYDQTLVDNIHNGQGKPRPTNGTILYMSLMALEKVEHLGTAAPRVIEIDPILELDLEPAPAVPDAPQHTLLVPFHDLVLEKLLPTSSLQQIASFTFMEFQRLLDELSMRKADPNFWPPIVG